MIPVWHLLSCTRCTPKVAGLNGNALANNRAIGGDLLCAPKTSRAQSVDSERLAKAVQVAVSNQACFAKMVLNAV